LATALKKKYSVESTLIEKGNGIFDVEVDGKMIFSKHKAGRFPGESEIINLVDAP